MFGWRVSNLLLILLPAVAGRLHGQLQIRVGDSARTLYSEIHDGLREGTPAADSVLEILRAPTAGPLWRTARRMLKGMVEWNTGLLALTRIAELRDSQSLDSAVVWRRQILSGQITPPPATDLNSLLPFLHAIELELTRARRGDLAVLNGFLPRIPSGRYDLADAWVFGRLGNGAADSVVRRFLDTSDQALRIRYLTVLSFTTDTVAIPLLARIYVAPDSFGLPLRIGTRASDGLIWIGTKRSVQALLDARSAARARATYVDQRLRHADLDFLGNDSSLVVSRTGRWLTEWLDRLPAEVSKPIPGTDFRGP